MANVGFIVFEISTLDIIFQHKLAPSDIHVHNRPTLLFTLCLDVGSVRYLILSLSTTRKNITVGVTETTLAVFACYYCDNY